MEVTIENFEEVFPLLEDSIRTADFIALDTEFSGINVQDTDEHNEYDSVEERYQKVKFQVQKFTAFQFGICTFHFCYESKKYLARPYCFYVFPRSKITDMTMLFQSNAISFLAGNNFDFNKLFQQGISFARQSEAQEVYNQCVYKVTKNFPSERCYSSLSESHQRMLNDCQYKIDDWVYDPHKQNKLVFNIPSYSLKKALSKQVTKHYMKSGIFTEFQRGLPETVVKKSKSFNQSKYVREPGRVLTRAQASQSAIVAEHHPQTNSADRGYLSDEMDMFYPEELSEGQSIFGGSHNGQRPTQEDSHIEEAKSSLLGPTLSENSSVLGLSNNLNDSHPKHQNLTKEQLAQVDDCYKKELGFTRVVQVLQESKRPIVGHNMFFDIAFFYEQFIGRLPKTYIEFTTQWKARFGETYDTKTLAENAGEFNKTALSHLFYRCQKDKRISNNLLFGFDELAHEKFRTYESQHQEHDAGYDAYMTGHVFAALAKRLEIGQLLEQSSKKAQLRRGNEEVGALAKRSPRACSKGPNSKSSQEDQTSKRTKTNGQLKGNSQEAAGKRGTNSGEGSKGGLLAPVTKIKSVHYSTIQNKPVCYESLDHLCNRLMFNIDIPRYFCLDLIDTKPVFETQKKKGATSPKNDGGEKIKKLQGRIKLTDTERDHETRLADFTFQLELSQDLSTRDVAVLFIDHGDVTVVKAGPYLYWVDFESFDSTDQQSGTLGRIMQQMRNKHRPLIKSIRDCRDAKRFPQTILSIGTRTRPNINTQGLSNAPECKQMEQAAQQLPIKRSRKA